MNRRANAAATMLGIALLEGALGLSSAPATAQSPAPSPFDPLPRIQDSINASTPPGAVAPAAVPTPRTPAIRKPATTTTTARPSPFAVPAAVAVRPRAIAATPANASAGAPASALPAVPVTTAPASPDLPAIPVTTAPAPKVGEDQVRPPADASLQTTSREVDAAAVPSPDAAPDPSMAKIATPARHGTPTGEIAATVGAEKITQGELAMAMNERLDGTDRSKIPDEIFEAMGRNVLERLIQRTLVIQAAKVKLKNEKNWANFMKQVENVWNEHEVPELIQKYGVKDKYELRKAMERRSISFDRVHDAFKLQTAANEFVRNELQTKMKVDLPEQRAYYEAHLAEFNRPAQVTWREVVVEVGKNKGHANARRKAEVVLARLRAGEDFEAVARAHSEGPNAKKGGLWETAPGSYAVPTVNDALENLPLGQVSAILEGPDAYHIIRVEDRRAAGPATFFEVQLKIRELIKEEKYNKGAEAYFLKLRDRTIITSPMFEGTPGVPPSVNAQASATPPAPATPTAPLP